MSDNCWMLGPGQAVVCHPRCDGITGLTTDVDPDDRIPVACPVHRPEAAAARARAAARERSASRSVARPGRRLTVVR